MMKALAGMFAATALAGCSTTMTFGSMPRTDSLSALKVSTSTGSDVVATLGEPRGRGQVQFSADRPVQQVWSYEYIQSNGSKVRLKMLLVFLENDTYAGYMWFSSNQLLETKP